MNGQPNPARIAHLFLLRLAEAPQDDLLDDGPKLKKDNSHKLFSSKTRTAIIKAYGRKGWLFFALYRNVYRTFLGYPPPPEGLAPLFKASLLVVRRQLDKEETVNQFSEYTTTILMGLKKIDRGTTSTTIWKNISENYSRLILAAAEDKDLYLIERKMPGTGSVPWNALWLMPKKQQELERVRHEDPDLYDRLLESKDLRKKINAGVEREVLRDNRVIGRSNIRGRVVITGTNPKVEGDVYVYDDDGERLTKGQYAEKLTKKREQYKALRKPPTLTNRQLDSIRTIPAEVMAKLEGKPTKYKALTDDPDLSTSLTRIYEVVEVWGVEVVASGKYKGMAMPDLVNRLGRQVDGRIYDYDPKTGKKLEIETKNPDGTKNIAISREPYATLDSKGLLLNIPGARHFKVIRNDLRKLSKLIPSIKLESVPGSQQLNVRFDPKDFAIIREKVGGMALSNAAMKFIKAHFDQLAKNELATAEENLGYYEAEKLGGFGEPWPGNGDGLTTKQKQALAWLDSNGNKGVCALDTGMGKCVRGDTLILTNKGLTPIQDMNPGISEPDTTAPVEGWSVLVGGEALPVKNFYYGGPKPTIKVRTRRGYEVEGSRVHPLLVRTPDGQETWVQTPELDAGDYLCIERKEAPFPTTDPALSVPVAEDFQQRSRNPEVTFANGQVSVFPVSDRMTPDLGRLLAYIVAEGWTNSHKTVMVSQCPEKNPVVRADIEDLLQRLLGWTAKPDKDIRVNSVFLREYLLRMGVGMGVAKDKVVPEPIFRSSKETVRQFIRGLVDAEGHVNTKGCSHIEFSTASEQLGRELQILLLRFGIMCSRRPKRVKGYDHTYWRLHISGQDAVTYGEQIGFVSPRKQAAVEDAPETRNSNLDVIPHLAAAVGGLFDTMLAVSGHTVSSLSKQLGSRSFDGTVNHVRRGRRNPTPTFLRQMLSLAVDLGVHRQDLNLVAIDKVLNRGFFYDPIEVMEESEAVVMDIEVDDPQHCFVGNGVMNHNTVTSIAIMQKLERDGLLDDPDQGNGRYLYVCPAALKGNVAKEMYKFLIDADGMLEKTDVKSYAEFTKLRGKLSKVPLVNPTGRKKFETKWVSTKFGEDYVAIFFDEAQALKNPGSQRSMAASSLNHPRKILMTASPMERSPQEVYSLTAISNNIDLTTKDAKADRNRFMRRFSESVGGRIVGIKSEDPVTARDFRVWVKQNLYFADKRDPKAIALPELKSDGGTAVTMPPEIEKAYKAVTKSIAKELKEASKKFKADPRQMSLAMESLKVKLASEMFEMTRLANIPNWEFEDIPAPTAKKPNATKRKWTRNPDIPNAKMDMAGGIVAEKIAQDTSTLTLMFTDSPEMAMESAIQMSEKFPGRAHIIGFAGKIEVWANNKRLQSFGPRAYVDLTTGEEIDKGEWKVHVLHHLATNTDPVRGDKLPYEVATATLTSTYAVGQNLQMFSTVVHLDRDTWNSETMKQRTARAWRAGQESEVEERTLDVAYSDTTKKNDQTLDDVRKVIQEMDAALFDEVVVDSQAEVLGVEWHNMKKNESALHEVNKRMLEMSMSPYAANLAEES